MDRMKTFFKYAMWIVLFGLFSNLLIYLSLNSTYRDIHIKDNVAEQVIVKRAEATSVNGRMLGTVKNIEANDINGKYIEIDLYSSRNVLLGTKYIKINNLAVNQEEDFEVYFKLQNIEYYNINIVDKIPETGELGEFLTEDMKETAIWALLAYMIFF